MVWFGVVVTMPQTRLERMYMTLLLGACACTLRLLFQPLNPLLPLRTVAVLQGTDGCILLHTSKFCR